MEATGFHGTDPVAVAYAERLADLLEPIIDTGVEMKTVLKRTMRELNTKELTKDQRAWAYAILSNNWAYGGALDDANGRVLFGCN